MTFVNDVSAILNLATTINCRTRRTSLPTTVQLVKLRQENDWVDPLRQSLMNDFDLIVEADRLHDGFRKPKKQKSNS